MVFCQGDREYDWEGNLSDQSTKVGLIGMPKGKKRILPGRGLWLKEWMKKTAGKES
jgi:hypothetical protein